MFVKSIYIKGFRGIKNLLVEFNSDVTVLIGENNVGKSTILDALEYCLSSVRSNRGAAFEVTDFYHSGCEEDVLPIELTLQISLSETEPADNVFFERFVDVVVGDVTSEIRLRVRAELVQGEVRQSVHFLDSSDQEIPSGTVRKLRDLQESIPICYLRALRDAESSFQGKSSFWSSLLDAQNFNEDVRQGLSEKLENVYSEIISSASGFEEILRELAKMPDMVSTGVSNDASVRPVVQDLVRVLRYGSEINIASDNGAYIPLRSYGDGTKNLAVLMLFVAYLKDCVINGVAHCAPLIVVEEPEAHLHPMGVRSTWQLIASMPGQKIVASHSGDLMAQVPLRALRRISKCRDVHLCRSISNQLCNNKALLQTYAYFISSFRGSLLFSRTWFFVEGQTDIIAINACAEVLGIDLIKHGISLVPFAGTKIEDMISIANELGVNWAVMADGDDAGNKDMRICRQYVMRSQQHVHYFFSTLGYRTIEVSMCMAGYGELYVQSLTGDQKSKPLIVAPKTKWNVDFWNAVYDALVDKRKISTMLKVVERMKQIGVSGVPEDVKTIIEIVQNIDGDEEDEDGQVII